MEVIFPWQWVESLIVNYVYIITCMDQILLYGYIVCGMQDAMDYSH